MLNLHLALEEDRTLGVGFGRGVGDELERLPGELEEELALGILEERPKLYEVGHEGAEPRIRRKPALSEGHRHARSVPVDPEGSPHGGHRRLVERHVCERVRLVTGRGKEPRLGIRGAEAEVDAAAPSSGGSDRGIGIGQELRDDLG